MKETSEVKEAALVICGNPLCNRLFEISGLPMEPKRYCNETCRMDAWVIRRASKLLEGLSDERIIEIVKGAR